MADPLKLTDWLATHQELATLLAGATGKKKQAYTRRHDECVSLLEHLCDTVYHKTLTPLAKALQVTKEAVVSAGHPRWGVDVRVVIDRRIDLRDHRYVHDWTYRVYVTAEDADVQPTPFLRAETGVRVGFFPLLAELALEIERLDLAARVD